jgi:hypothetical protein
MLMAAIVLTTAFAVFVVVVLIRSRMPHRSPDQKILLRKSQN